MQTETWGNFFDDSGTQRSVVDDRHLENRGRWNTTVEEKSAVHQTAAKDERPTKIRPWKYWTYVVYSDEPAMLSDQIRALYTDKK